MPKEISFNKEIQRKLIHFCSGIIPLLVYIYGKEIVLPKLLLFTILFLIIDFLKSQIKWISKLYTFLFKSILRENEIKEFTGASWFLLGDLISLLLFPEKIAIFSMFLLSVSDTAAALIGRLYGKTKIYLKSLEGSFAFCISGFLVSILFTEIPILIKTLTVIFATMIELIPMKINDNLTIPILSGSFCYLGINII